MLNAVNMNLTIIESMMFFWQSVIDREKVSEYYLTDVAKREEMASIYDEEFNEESVRKVLSAISNREMLNTTIQKERQFWSKNMRVTEDRELLNAMVSPIKTLNLNGLLTELNEKGEFPFEKIEIIFIPANNEDCFQKENKLYINFFKIMVDEFNGTGAVTIEGKSISDYISEKILEMDGVARK